MFWLKKDGNTPKMHIYNTWNDMCGIKQMKLPLFNSLSNHYSTTAVIQHRFNQTQREVTASMQIYYKHHNPLAVTLIIYGIPEIFA